MDFGRAANNDHFSSGIFRAQLQIFADGNQLLVADARSVGVEIRGGVLGQTAPWAKDGPPQRRHRQPSRCNHIFHHKFLIGLVKAKRANMVPRPAQKTHATSAVARQARIKPLPKCSTVSVNAPAKGARWRVAVARRLGSAARQPRNNAATATRANTRNPIFTGRGHSAQDRAYQGTGRSSAVIVRARNPGGAARFGKPCMARLISFSNSCSSSGFMRSVSLLLANAVPASCATRRAPEKYRSSPCRGKRRVWRRCLHISCPPGDKGPVARAAHAAIGAEPGPLARGAPRPTCFPRRCPARRNRFPSLHPSPPYEKSPRRSSSARGSG